MAILAGPLASAEAQPVSLSGSTISAEAQQRKANRDRLFAQAKKRKTGVPATPGQLSRERERKLAQRLSNRKMLAMHPRWEPGVLGGSEKMLNRVRDKRRVRESQTKLRTVLQRLKSQLGKPYQWGGASPHEGFDCSGLVFYAFNHVLEQKLPRTANSMFQDNRLKRVQQQHLKKGDLIFFNINQRPGADHVGVYLGEGQFIEAPRTGLTIRISQLTSDFWQQRYLGARRVL
ncbi:hypothetical protein PANNVG_03085 [Pantoea sp. Nvir]|uniref:C40 family peptidase n=1 Tax=Pantoea sp. Nvir TaxID=2576760 RepID=UPI0030D5EC91